MKYEYKVVEIINGTISEAELNALGGDRWVLQYVIKDTQNIPPEVEGADSTVAPVYIYYFVRGYE